MTGPTGSSDSRHIILMAGADRSDMAALRQALEGRGHQVLLAPDGEQTLRQARFARPDLVLLDASLAGPGGAAVCRLLRQDQELRDIPVLLIIDPAGMDGLDAFEAGAADQLPRPLVLGEALARIDTHLSLRAARRRLAELEASLQHESALRRQIESYLQHAYEMLEERVTQRTEQLAHANALLTAEIGERTRAEESLRRSEVRMRRLVEANIIGIYFWAADGRVVEANDAFLRLLGYTQEDVKQRRVRWDTLTPPEYRDISERAWEELRTSGSFAPYEKEYLRKDGSRVPILVGGTVISKRQQSGVAFVLDLTERKLAEERIRYMADHDALTGLPNRVLLQDRLQQAVAHAARTHTLVALMFIDLDYFKHINDSLGHQVGDCLLQDVARRLLHCVREGDSVARLGGDEFVLALPLVGGGHDVAIVAQKVLDALDAPFHCGDHELHVSGSIGISMYPDDGKDVETLMRTADTAMYYAKEKGRGNFQFFTQSLNRAAQRRHQLTIALRHALNRNEFVLYYQPQVDLDSGAIFAAEALLRWKREGEAPVGCNEFIAIAEETGLILPIGEWVLREACKQLRRWHEHGFGGLYMAVNLSPRQFFQPNFEQMVREALEDADVPPNRLDLEITEGILMQRTEDNVATLKVLSDMGIKLSIDDFGTGYSSLAYLQRFPVDALKIDRSFVSGIGQDSNDTALVAAIISMANSLRLKVLAEGVETNEQRCFLQSHGCPAGQGFYYSGPVSAEEFTEMLLRQSRRMIDA
ncbi:two-component system response regulator [Noviherbaspirillum aerium]|uniref:two-component system response regulator n=1 Tax=Noviherbaspirillum aerium TaxID=2588497 RepID=UPI00124BE815|nr:EAL domain-containing protein [Noviherbaspirillum aerium]